MQTNTINKLHDAKAGTLAVAYARGYDTMQEAWDACKQADWLIWVLLRSDQASDLLTMLREEYPNKEAFDAVKTTNYFDLTHKDTLLWGLGQYYQGTTTGGFCVYTADYLPLAKIKERWPQVPAEWAS